MNRPALPAVLAAGACVLGLASCSGQSASKPPNAASPSATAIPPPTMSVSAAGSLVVRATGPRLCLDTVTTVLRHYTVVRATGTLRHLHGAGTITLAVLSTGATETWTPPR